MDNLIKFDQYTFHAELGELVHTDETGNKTISRLQPQPSKLLVLLIESYPNILSREQIKESIWPDVHVDFDGSLHFCIRQIRAALNDDSSNPKFIETIPRRGYRWIAAVQPSSPESKPEKNTPSTKKENKSKKVWIISLVGLLFLSALIYFNQQSSVVPESTAVKVDKVRIAIMPLQPKDSGNAFIRNNMAIRLVESLGNKLKAKTEIIGPTTTSTFDAEDIWPEVEKNKIDFIINGKFSMEGEESIVLIEIIKASDGSHLWVKSFPATEKEELVLGEIEAGLTEILNGL